MPSGGGSSTFKWLLHFTPLSSPADAKLLDQTIFVIYTVKYCEGLKVVSKAYILLLKYTQVSGIIDNE